jgi:hypothetical protein
VARWRFSKDAVARLKKDFTPSSSSSNEWISSGDALSALIWGVLTRSRENIPRVEGRSSIDSQVEKAAMAADGRDRAPKGDMANGRYLGNFNLLFNVSVPRADLISTSNEASTRVALRIRRAIQEQVGAPEAVAHKIAFFEAPENTIPPGRIVWSSDVIMTNWCAFDLQGPKLDLGWGKPFSTTSGSGGPYPPGYVIISRDYDESGGILMLVAVDKEAISELKADMVLNQYAVPITG